MPAESLISGPPASGYSAASQSLMPLFHAAWLFALGIVVAHWLWLRPSLVLAALAPMALLCGLAAFRAPRIVWLPLAVLWCLLGAWCGLMEPQPAAAPKLASLSDGLLRTVEGTVVDAGAVRGETVQDMDQDEHAGGQAPQPSQRIDLNVSNLEAVTDTTDAQVPVEGVVRLTIRWPEDAAATRSFGCGQRVRALVRLLPPEIYHDPGVWSREDFLARSGHHILGHSQPGPSGEPRRRQ